MGLRISSLSSLRGLVGLPPHFDVTRRQWFVLENQLSAVQGRLLARLKGAARRYLPNLSDAAARRQLNAALGHIELQTSKAFTFFDAYMDVLTQRHSPSIGPLLAGCDVLAEDSLRRDHPALSIVEPPIVFLDRGFGASIIREDVSLPGMARNPMPMIQIPYVRLREKYNLTSICHESGHEALKRLRLDKDLPRAFRQALREAGATTAVQDFYSLWTSEIGPDFWGFCLVGVAQGATIREILALPADQMFRVSHVDPHPPPYLRALLAFRLARDMWGRGRWDAWESEWRLLYPLEGLSPGQRRLFATLESHLPLISRTLLETRFATLQGRRIRDLFDLDAVSPHSLASARFDRGSPAFKNPGLSPCGQLAAFRFLRDNSHISEGLLDRLMGNWLAQLGTRRNAS